MPFVDPLDALDPLNPRVGNSLRCRVFALPLLLVSRSEPYERHRSLGAALECSMASPLYSYRSSLEDGDVVFLTPWLVGRVGAAFCVWAGLSELYRSLLEVTAVTLSLAHSPTQSGVYLHTFPSVVGPRRVAWRSRLLQLHWIFRLRLRSWHGYGCGRPHGQHLKPPSAPVRREGQSGMHSL